MYCTHYGLVLMEISFVSGEAVQQGFVLSARLFLVCVASGAWVLGVEVWQMLVWIPIWHTHTLGCKIFFLARRRYPFFHENVWKNIFCFLWTNWWCVWPNWGCTWTSEKQKSSQLSHKIQTTCLRNGQAIEVLHRGSTHKWLGCMLCTANTGNHTSDLAHHLQAASHYAHRPVLVNRNVKTVSNIWRHLRRSLGSIVRPRGAWIRRCRAMTSFVNGTKEIFNFHCVPVWGEKKNLPCGLGNTSNSLSMPCLRFRQQFCGHKNGNRQDTSFWMSQFLLR